MVSAVMSAPGVQLAVDEGLVGKFSTANAGCVLQVGVREECLVLLEDRCSSSSSSATHSSTECEASEDAAQAEAAFSGAAALVDAEACCFLLIFVQGKWLCVSWIPTLSSVREKMIFSSSKGALKNKLGLSLFHARDYMVSSADELTFDSWRYSKAEVLELNEREEAIANDIVEVAAEQRSGKTFAMGVVPFSMEPLASEALLAFREGKRHLVSLSVLPDCKLGLTQGVASEGGELLLSSDGEVAAAISSALPSDSPCFLCIRRRGEAAADPASVGQYFVYCCPSTAPVREKMCYSTAKTSALSELRTLGVQFDKIIEVDGAQEIPGRIKEEEEERNGVANGGATSKAAEHKHSKPKRPGRGRARNVKKFVADDSDL